jgi:putative glutamine amidotransferase
MCEKTPSSPRPRIGISANWLPPVAERRLYPNKPLQYAEHGLIDWVWREGGLPVVLPVVEGPEVAAFAESCDGLLLSGGEDVSPQEYGELPRRPEWAGNPARDRFERALFESFAQRGRPVLGVCRGLQLVNVALGGSLHQDLLEDGVVAAAHRDQATYCRLRHRVRLFRGGLLHALYGLEEAWVNTVHHQGIRGLGAELEVLAESADGLVEAVRHRTWPWVVAV